MSPIYHSANIFKRTVTIVTTLELKNSELEPGARKLTKRPEVFLYLVIRHISLFFF